MDGLRPTTRMVVAALAIGASAGHALAAANPGGQGAPSPRGTSVLLSLFNNPTALLLVGAGLIVVVVVGKQWVRTIKAKEPPGLEERFAKLVAERAARGESGAGGASGVGLATTGLPFPVSGSQASGRGSEPSQITELRTVMADAEELADRLSRALDAQAERLETLMRQADDYLRRVEATKRHSVVEARPSPAATVAAARSRPSISLDDDSDPLQRQVYELADSGATPLDIARQLNQPTGQVELILALRPR
ncbi:MAG: hypothetical protein R3B68_06880 [Phycisphaerales bacterium]